MKKVISIAAALIIALFCVTLTAHADGDMIRDYQKPLNISLPGMPKTIKGYTEYDARYLSLITDRADYGANGFVFPLAEAKNGGFYTVSYQVEGTRISFSYTLKDGYTLEDYLDFLDSKKSGDQAPEDRGAGAKHWFPLMDTALHMDVDLPYNEAGATAAITDLVNTDGTVLYQNGERTGSGYGYQSFLIPLSAEEAQPTEATEAPTADPEPVYDVPHIAGCESLAEGVKISWNAVDGAPLYRVYYKSSSGWKKMGDTSDTSFIDTDVRSGSTYVYTVRCMNADGSDFISDFDHNGYRYTYNMASPEITRFSDTASGIRITWKPVPNAVKYRVYYKGSKGWTRMAETSDTTYLDRDVRFGSTYTYTVRCITADGSRFTSDCNSTGWKHTHYLSTPQIYDVQSDAQGVRISWTAVEGAQKYRVYYKGRNGWTKMVDVSGTSYTDPDVRFGGTYTYTVRCVNAAGNTFMSGYNATGVKHTYYFETPQIKHFWDTGKGVRITWDAVGNAEKYRVYYYGRNGWTKMGETSDTEFIDDDVNVGSTYRYTVRCINDSGTVFMSDCNASGWRHTYEPDLYAPEITKLEVTSGGIRISWGEVYGADLYRVYYKGSKGWTRMADTRGTSYLDTDVSKNHTYTYTVRCLSSKGRGFASPYDKDGRSIRYLDTPYIAALGITGDGMRVEWDAINGAYEYRVFRKKAGGSWERVADTHNLYLYDFNVKPFDTYTYTVRCIDINGFYNSWFESEGLTHTYYTPMLRPWFDKMMLSEDGGLYIKINPGAVGVNRYAIFVKDGDDWKGVTVMDGTETYIDAGDQFVYHREYYFTVLGLNDNNEAVTDYYREGYRVTFIKPAEAFSVTKTGDRKYRFDLSRIYGAEKYYIEFYAKGDNGELIDFGPFENDYQDITVDLSGYDDDIEWLCYAYGMADDHVAISQPYIMSFCEQADPLLSEADETDIENLILAE